MADCFVGVSRWRAFLNMADSDAVTLYYNVAEATVGCIKQCYQGIIIDQATRNIFFCF